MNTEQRVFLRIINDYINGMKTEISVPINWKVLFQYGQMHQMTALIYQQCKELIPDEFADPFRMAFLSTISCNVRRKKLTKGILVTLEKAEIKCCLIKGLMIAEYYPNWQHRSMGDTDILVDDLEKAHSVLIDSGLQNISKIQDREYQYTKQNMEFELHDRLVYEEAINLESTTNFLNNYEPYLIDGKLDDSFHFIFVLNHLRKHFMNSGVGFRQFVDVAIMIKNDKKINWNWVEEKLSEIGLIQFAKTVFYYIEKWFSVTAPIISLPVTDDVFEKSTEYIFDNGIFGFSNAENKEYLASNNVRKSGFKRVAMFKSATQNLFPGYNTMIKSKNYAFLIGKPYLLPIAWAYRCGRAISSKRMNEGVELFSSAFVSQEYVAKREEMFNNWRLNLM